VFYRLLAFNYRSAMQQILCGGPAILFAAAVASASASAQAPITTEHAAAAAPLLSVEAIYAHGRLIGSEPKGLIWSPDSTHLTYLKAGELIDLNPTTAKSNVLVSNEQLAALSGTGTTEKDKDHRDRYKMASYLWSPDSAHLLFDVNGTLWFYDLKAGTGRQIGLAAASGDDPKFSPDGRWVSFVRDHGLSVVRIDLKDQKDSPIIEVGARPGVEKKATLLTTLDGEVDWVYEEELDVRSNYFWSPDSKSLAYLETNEAEVPEYPITDWIPTHPTVDQQRFPQPGDANPDVRVGVVRAEGGQTIWVSLPIKRGQDYIPRFGWVNPQTLWIEVLTRDHKHRDLYFADATNGDAHPVLQMTDAKFFNESYDVSVADGSLLLTSWADGHNHLYRYVYDPVHPTAVKLDRPLTSGEFEVDKILLIDGPHSTVVFSSNEGNPLNSSIWQASFDGQRHLLTTQTGSHEADFSPNGKFFVDTYSTIATPPTISLCVVASSCTLFWATQALDPYHVRSPRIITTKAHDGVTTLYSTLHLPEGVADAASVPLIVDAYGGPGVQSVANHWSDQLLFDEVLTRHGFAVLHTDNRGMAQRGRDFAQAAYHNFGAVQLEDQLTVIDAVLAQFPVLDKSRLGWWGWSWGGSFTLYAMSHSDRFCAGVAVAPVTDWRNYDSVYTERYLGLPSEFVTNYEDFSVLNSAAHLKGRLLLVHGTGDDNVHLENSIQYIQKLIEAGVPYDLQLYPRKTHSIAGADVRIHLFNRILAHFEQYLLPSIQTKKAQAVKKISTEDEAK